MPAINGVKKSAVVKKSKGKYGAGLLAIMTLVGVLVTVLAGVLFWKLYYEEKFSDQVIIASQQGQYQAYKAVRDISSGEYIDGAIEVVTVPNSLSVSNSISLNETISVLKASGNIVANTIITKDNTYDPEMQDTVLGTSRILQVNYLNMPGVEAGDFVDIRLKVSVDGDMQTYTDGIVCSKKEVLSKDESNNIQLMLSEAEILNLNSAVIEAANQEQTGEIYVAKYIDPTNQPKATVTYDGKGIKYTDKELQEAQDILKNNRDNLDLIDTIEMDVPGAEDVDSIDGNTDVEDNGEAVADDSTDVNDTSIDGVVDVETGIDGEV